MPPSFGTDGVRGVANVDLTPEFAVALGRAAAQVLGHTGVTRFLVGRDTRLSGPLLQAAFSAGVGAEGIDVLDLGVLPTPAIAFCAATEGAPAAVISASHNPFADNGIKLFAPGGQKLPDRVEAEIEALLQAELNGDVTKPQLGAEDVGSLTGDKELVARYVAHLLATLEGRRLEGLRVVLDCANGAASEAAPWALREAGADVTVLNAAPTGININAGCGSTRGLLPILRHPIANSSR